MAAGGASDEIGKVRPIARARGRGPWPQGGRTSRRDGRLAAVGLLRRRSGRSRLVRWRRSGLVGGGGHRALMHHVMMHMVVHVHMHVHVTVVLAVPAMVLAAPMVMTPG